MTKKKSSDFTLMLTVLTLVVIGIIMVFSSSHYYALSKMGDSYHFLKRELIWAGLGFVSMLATMNFNYKKYKKIAVIGYFFSLILLILVLTPLGIEYNGAKRWLGVGSITIMPGEISKICAIFFVASFLSQKPERIKSFYGVLPCLLIIGIYAALILKQPNLSTAVTIAVIIASMMFVTGMRWIHVAAMGFAGVAALILMIIAEPYRMRRLVGFLDPFSDPQDTGYQVIQSLLALGSGGLFGVGLGKSVQNIYIFPNRKMILYLQ